MNTQKLFYKDKSLFGLDIGRNSIKAMQLSHDGKDVDVLGYGVVRFNTLTGKDGVITEFERLAEAMRELFKSNINGKITSRRVAATIPAANAYSRVMSLPPELSKKELDDAVRFEAEQYIPIPLDQLYLDYTISNVSSTDKEILVVAVPKKIIDSYMRFFEILDLEVCAIETTISAAARLVGRIESNTKTPSILIDFGSKSVDLSIYDKFLVVNGTVPGGGDDFTERIAERLDIGKAEANTIKKRYGLGISKKQAEIREALAPQLDQLMKEIRRVVRYYEERTQGKSKIDQVITMGGGANMPGINDYLTDNLRLPTRMTNFWGTFNLRGLGAPSEGERSVYVTVAGAALIKPAEIWKS